MNDAFFKPSLNVGSFIGENSSVDTERFLLFIKAYYEWMQSTTVSLTNKTGTFVVGETVVGVGATYIIRAINQDVVDDGFAANKDIETEADLIIDFTERNPFGQA